MNWISGSTRTPHRAMLPVILAAQLVIPMSIAGTAIALPNIADDLGAHPTGLQWVVNGFNLTFAAGTIVWGVLADRIGHRRAFRIGVAVALLGTVASAVAPSLLTLDLARLLAGAGAAAVLTGATALISHTYNGPARTRAFAIFGTVNGLGLAIGPSVSGLLIGGFGWRGVFVAQATVLAAAALGARVLLPVQVERVPGPVLDLGLLRIPRFLSMALVPVAGALGFVTFLTYLPNALSAVRGTGPALAGAAMLAATVPVLLAPLAVGAVVARGRVQPATVIVASLGSLVVGDLLMLTLRPDGSVLPVLLAMMFVGLGFGLPVGLVDGEALAAAPAERAGTAAGLLNFARIGSEALAVAAYSALLAALITAGVPDARTADLAAAGRAVAPASYTHAFHVVALLSAVLVALIALAVLLLQRRSDVQISGQRQQVSAEV